MRGICGLTAFLVLCLAPGLGQAVPDREAPDAQKVESTKPKDLIVGKWEIIEDKQSGTIEFKADGTMMIVVKLDGNEIPLKGTYKFTAEDALVVEFTPPIEGADKLTQKLKIAKIDKNELITKDEKGKEDKFKRVKQQ